ncbi:MAG: hypothetical protein RLY93_14445 [Sumerlaeia bacterium]
MPTRPNADARSDHPSHTNANIHLSAHTYAYPASAPSAVSSLYKQAQL